MKYVTLLKKDTGLDSTHEIETVMLCRETWSGVARRVARELQLGGGVIMGRQC